MARKPHICILSPSRLSESLEKFSVLLGNWLVASGYDVTILGSTLTGIKVEHLSKFTDSRNGNGDQTSSSGQIKVRKLAQLRRLPYIVYMLSRIYLTIRWSIQIIAIHRQKSIDLLHAQDTGYAGLAAVLMGKLLKIPIIITSHGIRHKAIEASAHRFNPFLLSLEYKLDLFTINNSTGFIVVNPAIRDYYLNKTRQTIHYIPIALNIKDYNFSEINRLKFRKSIGVQDDTQVIGFVGRFSPEKNVIGILSAFERVAKSKKNICLVLVGGGPLEPSVKKIIRERSLLESVKMCGIRNDVNEILSGIDIFILPSFIEGLPYSLLEAMACERPIICSNLPVNRELFTDGEDAILIDPYNQESIVNALILLIEHPAIKVKFAHNSKLKVAKFDSSIIFPQMIQFYRKFV